MDRNLSWRHISTKIRMCWLRSILQSDRECLEKQSKGTAKDLSSVTLSVIPRLAEYEIFSPTHPRSISYVFLIYIKRIDLSVFRFHSRPSVC